LRISYASVLGIIGLMMKYLEFFSPPMVTIDEKTPTIVHKKCRARTGALQGICGAIRSLEKMT
jgi:hypothetical protein